MKHIGTSMFETERLLCRRFEENDKSGKVLKKSSMHIIDNVERFRRLGEEPVGEICYCIEKQ